ncbi:MAG: Metallophosphoesterase [Candidatus Collierbacteria bacterium GW2011_GWC2_44_18]|uniref:Phosphoesterase n=2 Tax=Microgenomates group TaxID=1794810 RepID=A0A0G1LE44_9BACT|nr:MAG: Metallophosphoesterase [Microgenomates group bacterium GW2011_GWC1_44_10]KKT48680.1 MAG: Metallophosphoesterase [Candidatus Collierbacteria bacterium GW2011_GWC2_44_18]KKT66982.1 MAG: Metallophosphoesterase [Candidatus Woesebacteria bacterium GW2011_GWA2_44_33]
MKIAIISDTHDNMRILNKTVNYLNLISIDLLIHCGDWDMPFTMRGLIGAKFPIKSVLGNGDPDIQKFLYQLQNLDVLKDLKLDIQLRMQDFILDGKRICVFHGDDKSISKLIIDSQFYDLYCMGHDHQFSVDTKGKTTVVNPGSFVGFKIETGAEPINMVIYDTEKSTTEIVDLEKDIGDS